MPVAIVGGIGGFCAKWPVGVLAGCSAVPDGDIVPGQRPDGDPGGVHAGGPRAALGQEKDLRYGI